MRPLWAGAWPRRSCVYRKLVHMHTHIYPHTGDCGNQSRSGLEQSPLLLGWGHALGLVETWVVDAWADGMSRHCL